MYMEFGRQTLQGDHKKQQIEYRVDKFVESR